MNQPARHDLRPGEQGAILLVALAVLVIVGVLAATLTTLVSGNQETNVVQQTGNQAFYLAESGGRYAIARLRAEKLAAVPDLDGRTFTLANGWGFELTVTTTDTGPTYIFRIDSVGFIGSGANTQRQSLNGYQVEVPKYDDTIDIPTAFPYSVQSLGTSPVTISGSGYVDSYDSAIGDWTTQGGIQDASIRTSGTAGVLDLSWSTILYGSISVPTGTDISDPTTIVNRPENVLGDPKIVTEDVAPADPIPPPDEPAEVAMPTSWDPLASIGGKKSAATQTISGGDYWTPNDFDPGSTAITATDSLGLKVGRDFILGSSGSLAVGGDLSAWITRDFGVGGGGKGLAVHGDADLQVGNDFSVGNSQQVVVDGDLDLDVTGDLVIDGSASLHVKGDAYIDVGGSFSILGGGSMVVDGDVIIHVASGFTLDGWSTPLVIGPNGSVQVYVDSGAIAFASAAVNTSSTPADFLVFGGSGVTTVDISGSSAVVGAIYAPSAAFTLSGSSQLFGAVLADSVSVSGSSSIHYDQALTRVSPQLNITEYPLRRYWVAVGNTL